MAYKVLVQVYEGGDWDPVLDMKRSRSRIVPRLFMKKEATLVNSRLKKRRR